MGILDNARYAEIGKQTEEQLARNNAVADAAPLIEKEAIRRATPVIQEQTARSIWDTQRNGLSTVELQDRLGANSVLDPRAAEALQAKYDMAAYEQANAINADAIGRDAVSYSQGDKLLNTLHKYK